MKTVKLIYNPNAGDGTYDPKELIKMIEEKGFKYYYTSIKKDSWKDIESDVDIIAIAGGDGAVRKACKLLLQRSNLQKKLPLAVIPLGTANNIGNYMGLMKPIADLVDSWNKNDVKQVDIGLVSGHGDEPLFFVEGFGFGIFPNLMNVMKKMDEAEKETAEESLNKALEVLLETVKTYEARKCELVIDGTDHSGKFLLVEIMNMPSIGPNLGINPVGDPGDGELEIIVIPENHRERLIKYVTDKMQGADATFSFSTLKGKDISVTWEGKHAHVDDEIIKAEKRFNVTIDVNKSVLEFIIPGGDE